VVQILTPHLEACLLVSLEDLAFARLGFHDLIQLRPLIRGETFLFNTLLLCKRLAILLLVGIEALVLALHPVGTGSGSGRDRVGIGLFGLTHRRFARVFGFRRFGGVRGAGRFFGTGQRFTQDVGDLVQQRIVVVLVAEDHGFVCRLWCLGLGPGQGLVEYL